MEAIGAILGTAGPHPSTDKPAPRHRVPIPTDPVLRRAIDRLNAIYPYARQWPERKDHEAWEDLVDQWRYGLTGMVDQELAEAVEYYPRSAEGRFPPQPGGLFAALRELQQQRAASKEVTYAPQPYRSWTLPPEQCASREFVQQCMAEIRRTLRGECTVAA